MKKILFIIMLTALLLLSAAGCGEQAPPSSLGDIAPAPTTDNQSLPSSGTDLPPETDPKESALPSETPDVDDSATMATYEDFLNENYDALYEACFGGISGIGFIDLDLDGHREMLLFDAGASASMGVQFFDCVDGQVECVSANMFPMGEVFGGDHFTDDYVNANYFEDFRLVEIVETGERLFLVESANGSAEFYYRELISFGQKDGFLTLTPLFYKLEEFDIDTGETFNVQCRINDADASLGDYEKAYADFLQGVMDLGLEAQGVFLWENSSYAEGREGFMSIAREAMTLSENNFIK